MSAATIAPEAAPAVETDDVDGVFHLVCDCQIDEQNLPRCLPLVALCGDDGMDPFPPAGSRRERGMPCVGCMESDRCPVCNKEA